MKMLRAGMMAMAGVVLAEAGTAQSGGVDTTKVSGQSIVITQGQNRQTIHLHVGDEAVVTLGAASGIPFVWQMAPLNSPVAVLAGTENVVTSPMMPGGPVKHLFRLQIKSAGTVTLRFALLPIGSTTVSSSPDFTVTLQAQ